MPTATVACMHECVLRENEGDLIMAGDHITTEAMAFFVQHTSGVVRAGTPCAVTPTRTHARTNIETEGEGEGEGEKARAIERGSVCVCECV